MPVERISGAGPAPATTRVRRRDTGFALPGAGEAVEAELPAAAMPAPVPLLTLQAAESEAKPGVGEAAADHAAARHGETLLGALRGLQLAMLGGAGAEHDLARLADGLPHATDPGLDSVLRAIAQRAAVERARRE